VTAKERVLAEAPGWTEEQAELALRAVAGDGSGEGQPRFSLIGAFRSDRDDLGRLASQDVYEPERFR
jgi:hypothetical protein